MKMLVYQKPRRRLWVALEGNMSTEDAQIFWKEIEAQSSAGIQALDLDLSHCRADKKLVMSLLGHLSERFQGALCIWVGNAQAYKALLNAGFKVAIKKTTQQLENLQIY